MVGIDQAPIFMTLQALKCLKMKLISSGVAHTHKDKGYGKKHKTQGITRSNMKQHQDVNFIPPGDG